MDVFTALKRVFSTGMIVNNVSDNEVRVIDTQRSQAYSRRHNDFFSKLRKGLIYNTSLSQNYVINRLALYRDYDMMDTDPIVHAVLDVYVFLAFTKNEMGLILTIKCDDQLVTLLLYELFYKRLNCLYNFNIWFRTLLKYGDNFLALKLDELLGIYGCSPVSPYDILRVEDEDSEKYTFRLSTMGGELILNYNIAHFRMMTDPNFLPYGSSILLPARRIWKNFNLMVDAMLIQRIMRAPLRRVFKIDVGDIPQEEVTPYMTDIINKMKKVPYRDPNTGEINLRYNMMNLLEDFYIPVRGTQDGSNIDTLAGMENSFTEDILFIKSYMLAAFKVPKAFLTFELGIEAKATLSQLDIIFGRAVLQYQGLFVNELYRIALIHLFMLGYTDLDSLDFTLSLNNPSIVKQLQDIDFWSQKVDLGQKMKDSEQFSVLFIYKHIYKMSEELIQHERLQIIKDKLYNTKKLLLTSLLAADILNVESAIIKIYSLQDIVDNIINKAELLINAKKEKSEEPAEEGELLTSETRSPLTPKLLEPPSEELPLLSLLEEYTLTLSTPELLTSSEEPAKKKVKITKKKAELSINKELLEDDLDENKNKTKSIKISKKGRPKSNLNKRSKNLPDTELEDANLNILKSPLTPVFNGKSPLATK